MLPWELQRNADYLLGLIPRPGSRKPEEENKVLSNINENLLRSLGQHSEPLTASLTLNFSQNRWGDFVFPIFTRIRGRQNPVRTLCCSTAPLPFSHFSHTAPFTGSERFTTKELKPELPFQSNRHFLWFHKARWAHSWTSDSSLPALWTPSALTWDLSCKRLGLNPVFN